MQQLVGQIPQSIENLERSISLLEELARQDPSNLNYRWNLYRKTAHLAALFATSGHESESWPLSLKVEEELRKLLDEDQEVSVLNESIFAEFLLQYSDLAFRRYERQMAADISL